MGLKITKRVWEHSSLNGSDKLMLLALADHADEDGFCWPSYVTLAELTGTNPGPKNDCRQAKRTMSNLRKSGELIIWEQQGQHGGRGYTNLYLIVTGLSEQEVFEIVTRRFDLTTAEVPSVISKKGDVYTTLSYLKRVTSETLLRTREAKKGGIDDVQVPERVVSKAQKGGIDTTRTIKEPSIKPSESKSGGKPPAPPGVTVFIEVTKRHVLNNTQILEIDERVGRDPSALDKWRETVQAWQLAGHKINNISGMLDWFKKGIPVYAQKASQNGTHQRSSKQTKGQLTGHDSKLRETIDFRTGERVLPDGTRIPIVNDTS